MQVLTRKDEASAGERVPFEETDVELFGNCKNIQASPYTNKLLNTVKAYLQNKIKLITSS